MSELTVVVRLGAVRGSARPGPPDLVSAPTKYQHRRLAASTALWRDMPRSVCADRGGGGRVAAVILGVALDFLLVVWPGAPHFRLGFGQ